MANFQTIKNCLKKLESKNTDDDRRQFCGVICQEAFDKLEIPSAPASGNTRHIGYLLVPRRLTDAEWSDKHGY
ncbi:MAG: hypothetical protein HGB11_08685 [Chlorobiales bacterium]|nr:hypothetical protein [Chlorobiales bacterium]